MNNTIEDYRFTLKNRFNKAFVDSLRTATNPWDELDNTLYRAYVRMREISLNQFSLKDYISLIADMQIESAGNTQKYYPEDKVEIDRLSKLVTNNTYNKCRQYLQEHEIEYLERILSDCAFLVTDTEMIVLYYKNLLVYTEEPDVPEWVKSCMVFPKDEKRSYEYIVFNSSSGEFETIPLDIDMKDINIKDSYNDDLPNDAIMDFFDSDDSGLVVLHGEPGTGKSTYIRHIIANCKNRCIYLDQNSFKSITDSSFIKTLIKYENSIIIIEDCESLLMDREDENNSEISALLNISDGILGDSFKFKVLCTFNSELSTIDKALLRKGRLKIRYKFDKLNKKKVKKLVKKLGFKDVPDEDMTLADLFNYSHKADYMTVKESKKIGFS